jgi:hypothetical protein
MNRQGWLHPAALRQEDAGFIVEILLFCFPGLQDFSETVGGWVSIKIGNELKRNWNELFVA